MACASARPGHIVTLCKPTASPFAAAGAQCGRRTAAACACSMAWCCGTPAVDDDVREEKLAAEHGARARRRVVRAASAARASAGSGVRAAAAATNGGAAPSGGDGGSQGVFFDSLEDAFELDDACGGRGGRSRGGSADARAAGNNAGKTGVRSGAGGGTAAAAAVGSQASRQTGESNGDTHAGGLHGRSGGGGRGGLESVAESGQQGRRAGHATRLNAASAASATAAMGGGGTGNTSLPRVPLGASVHRFKLQEGKLPINSTLTASERDDGDTPRSWAQPTAPSFNLRGRTYMNDRVKVRSPTECLYECIGADVFRGTKRLEHLARGLQLPQAPERPTHPRLAHLPPFLVCAWTFPDGQAVLFGKQSPMTPSGMLVQYMQLNEEVALRHVESGQIDLLNNLIKEPENPSAIGRRTEGRDRLKAIPKMYAPEKVKKMFSLPEWRLISSYNGKPVLTRPQHKFFRGPNYLEVDIDIYEFAYLARKSLEMFRTRVAKVTMDMAFTIEGRSEKELPELLLGMTRMAKIDYFKAPYFPEHLLGDAADGMAGNAAGGRRHRVKYKRGRSKTIV